MIDNILIKKVTHQTIKWLTRQNRISHPASNWSIKIFWAQKIWMKTLIMRTPTGSYNFPNKI